MIDCVGFIVPSSLGYIEDEQPRMVMTPWFEKEIPFNMAAEVKQELKGKHIRLLAGTNMAMVIEAVFSRMGAGPSIPTLEDVRARR